MSQYFDSEGNFFSTQPRIASENLPSKGVRYSVPEGIELRKDVHYDYYPVFGKSFSEIIASVEENGPFDASRKRRVSTKFTWNIGWTYQFDYSYAVDEESNKAHITLEISDVDVTYAIGIVLPTLIDDTSLNPVEKQMWKGYFSRLFEYEDDHVRIIKDQDSKNAAIASLKEITYLIFDYKSDTDTEKTVELFIRDETERIGRAWAKKIRERLTEYDRITNHGNLHEKRGSFFR